jgi:activator of 2-hydroxyglutaryl-CoA dehydratase
VVELLSDKLGSPVKIPPHPQFAGALGAALYAREA